MRAYIEELEVRIQASRNANKDLITACFPTYMVWRMGMNKGMRWELSVLMGVGLCAAAATFAKIGYVAGNMTNISDVTYAWAPLSLSYL
ncbi:hypothetical protein E8E12_009166 [Didymella heteroderae]|uniref:Uncharacterized protein n=1 Tax=Didymella heteroderae TaxID=1769908 RepID=A0A9P4WV12_9PLEO|nr:hypothetical protein E8E12_009166 [Didymella heteroderae]